MAFVELTELRKQIAANPFPLELDASRQAYEAMSRGFPVRGDVESQIDALGGRPCQWFSPANAGGGIILYLHGGGYSIGSLVTHGYLAAELADLTGARVALLDYRLAPEHPFPAGLDDATNAYRELLDTFPADSIALAGDSAGSGLLVAALVNLTRYGLAQPSCAYCMSPWVDLTCTNETMASKAGHDPLVTRQFLEIRSQWYLGDTDPRAPLASPVYADLSGLPPLFIQVGSDEILLGDSISLALAAGKARVAVSLEIAPDMIHGWQALFPILQSGGEALSRGAAFIRDHIG